MSDESSAVLAWNTWGRSSDRAKQRNVLGYHMALASLPEFNRSAWSGGSHPSPNALVGCSVVSSVK